MRGRGIVIVAALALGAVAAQPQGPTGDPGTEAAVGLRLEPGGPDDGAAARRRMAYRVARAQLARPVRGPAADAFAAMLEVVVPAGDLDGDGHVDLLVEDAEGAWLHAGSDGSLLAHLPSSEDAYDLPVPLGEDLDGDGRDDLVVFGARDVQGTTVGDCLVSCQSTGAWTWDVRLRSGADGVEQPLATFPAAADIALTVVETPAGAVIEYDLDLVDADPLAWAVRPGHGDGAEVMLARGEFELVESVRWAGLYPAAYVVTSTREVAGSVLLEGLDGVAGDVVWSHAAPMAEGFAYVEPPGQLDGRRASDALVVRLSGLSGEGHCVFTLVVGDCADDGGQAEMLASAIDAVTGAPLWELEPTSGWVDLVGHDVDGDGGGDLVVGGPFGDRKVHSGRDGRELWEVPAVPGAWIVLALGVDQEAGEAVFGGPMDERFVGFARVDGVTGEVVARDTVELPEVEAGPDDYGRGVAVGWGRDLDGDAVGDLWVQSEAFGEDPEPTDVAVAWLSSRRPHVIYEGHPGSGERWRPGWDLDGDAMVDVRATGDEGTTFLSSAGDEPEALWATDLPVLDGFRSRPVGAWDVLVASDEGTVARLVGRTGTVVWSADRRPAR